MDTRAVVEAIRERVDPDRLLERTAAVARFDRYQASRGIEQAADLVAAEAERAGLGGVEVHRWSPPAASGWWTFAPPTPWTPGRASLRLLRGSRGGGEREPVVSLRYPDRPYGLAAYSAPTPPGGLAAPVVREHDLASGADPRGRVALLDGGGPPGAAAERRLVAGGAVGLVACPTAGSPATPAWASGRLELAGGSPLRAFSLNRDELRRVRATPGPLTAELTVEAEALGGMPLVTGRLAAEPGSEGAGEVLVQAHLCHPAPGADDNAAGVAALVEMAGALAGLRLPRARAVRFVWAPEFVGTAAYLHDLVAHGPLPPPAAVVNLDLVGGPQHELGPVVVDPSPDHVGGPTTAVLEHCLEALPSPRRSYSGAERLRDWAWTTVGCTGASDHVLYGDRAVAVPAAGVGHVPGPRHHTSADTTDHVDPSEARRVAVAAAAAVAVLAAAAPPDARWLGQQVLRSGWRRLLRTAAQLDAAQPDAEPAGGDGGVVDPRAPSLRAPWCAHVVEAVRADLAGAAAFAGAADTFAAEFERFRDAARDLAGAGAPPGGARATGGAALTGDAAARAGAGPVLRRSWPGPFNLRAALGAAPEARRSVLEAWLGDDRAGAYTAMTALAQAIDGRTGEAAVVRRAAFTTGLAIDAERARAFLDALLAAGWAAEGEGQPRDGGVTAPRR